MRKFIRKIFLKPIKNVAIIFFACATFFLFSDATGISAGRLRGEHVTWYLSKTMDSTEFFSAENLQFYSPNLNFFHTENQLDTWQNASDSLEKYSHIKFGYFKKNEFAVYLGDSVLVGEKYISNKKQMDGKFSVDRKNKILTLDFYIFDGTKGSTDIDEWTKGVSIKYQITELTKNTLVLEKIKTE